MLKRLTALVFMFVLAAQISGGVCGCLGGVSEDTHSCCKREKSAIDSMQSKACCDSNCTVTQSERVSQDRTQAAAKLNFSQAAEPATAFERTPFRPLIAPETVTISHYTDNRLKYSRPPALYLRHHAFLI